MAMALRLSWSEPLLKIQKRREKYRKFRKKVQR
jgi:hypothetical protein